MNYHMNRVKAVEKGEHCYEGNPCKYGHTLKSIGKRDRCIPCRQKDEKQRNSTEKARKRRSEAQRRFRRTEHGQVYFKILEKSLERRERKRAREQTADSREKKRHYHRKAKYGIDRQNFEMWLAIQEHVCPICREPLYEGVTGSEQLCVDHDHNCCPGNHTCGKCVRGFLHRRCNTLLGLTEKYPGTWSENTRRYLTSKGMGRII
jgi:hypothetical protein